MRVSPPQLVGLLLSFVAVAAVSLAALEGVQPRTQLVIGCKNFTESRFLAHLLARAIEERSGLECQVRELASTSLCYDALQAGAIHLYPEYTGTLLVEVWRQPSLSDPRATLSRVVELAESHELAAVSPFGFDNTYVMAVRSELAERLKLGKVSQLTGHPDLLAGFPSEFNERPDGYPGLIRHYGLELRRPPVDLAPGHMYAAAARGQVDLISAFSTDARIEQFQLTLLEDDRGFFPSYQALTLIRQETLARWPQLRPILASLAGRLDEATMRSINGRIDQGGVPVRQAAEDFFRQLEAAPRT